MSRKQCPDHALSCSVSAGILPYLTTLARFSTRSLTLPRSADCFFTFRRAAQPLNPDASPQALSRPLLGAG
jgi:hypothetical protein